MKQGLVSILICLLAVGALAIDDRAVVDGGRDWRLSDLKKAIKASGKNLPEIITGISIMDEDTLTVYLADTRGPLSGVGADVTLRFSKESGWKVTKTTFSDR